MASAAILTAGITKPLSIGILIEDNDSLSSNNNFFGISPIISTGSSKIIFIAKAAISPTNDDGITLFHFLGHIIIIAITNAPINTAYQFIFKGP